MPRQTTNIMNATKYARLRFEGKTFKVKIISENAEFIHFAKVNAEGDETEDKLKKGVIHIQQHLVAKGLIQKRTPLFMSHKYGTLELQPDSNSPE
jgi:hypothetical protein